MALSFSDLREGYLRHKSVRICRGILKRNLQNNYNRDTSCRLRLERKTYRQEVFLKKKYQTMDNNQIIHTCHCLGQHFTVREWTKAYSDPKKVVHTFNGYKYNIYDVCLNPTILDLTQDKYKLTIKYCQSDCGKWSVGIDYLLGNSGGYYGCSFLPSREEGHISRGAAIYAGLKYSKNKIMTEIDKIKDYYEIDDNGNRIYTGQTHLPHLRKLLSTVQKQLFLHRTTQLTLFDL